MMACLHVYTGSSAALDPTVFDPFGTTPPEVQLRYYELFFRFKPADPLPQLDNKFVKQMSTVCFTAIQTFLKTHPDTDIVASADSLYRCEAFPAKNAGYWAVMCWFRQPELPLALYLKHSPLTLTMDFSNKPPPCPPHSANPAHTAYPGRPTASTGCSPGRPRCP